VVKSFKAPEKNWLNVIQNVINQKVAQISHNDLTNGQIFKLNQVEVTIFCGLFYYNNYLCKKILAIVTHLDNKKGDDER
jgi:hypothetical protein